MCGLQYFLVVIVERLEMKRIYSCIEAHTHTHTFAILGKPFLALPAGGCRKLSGRRAGAVGLVLPSNQARLDR